MTREEEMLQLLPENKRCLYTNVVREIIRVENRLECRAKNFLFDRNNNGGLVIRTEYQIYRDAIKDYNLLIRLFENAIEKESQNNIIKTKEDLTVYPYWSIIPPTQPNVNTEITCNKGEPR